MKKLIAIFMMVCFSTTMILAQTAKPAAKVQAKKATTEVKTAKADAKAAAIPTKKDGTPDMRYKVNKEDIKAAPVGSTKKDGTPDMHYKVNTEAAAKKK